MALKSQFMAMYRTAKQFWYMVTGPGVEPGLEDYAPSLIT